MKLSCKQCGGVMRRRTLSQGNCLGIALALVLFAGGVAISLTGIGALIGVPLILCSLFVGGKRRRVWRCTACSTILERA